MKRPLSACICACLSMVLVALSAAPAPARPHRAKAGLTPLALKAPDGPAAASGTGAPPACVTPEPAHTYDYYHCATPSDIASAYGVDALHGAGTMGQGQTIVLIDSYGSPTDRTDLQTFHDTFYPSLPDPNFTRICKPDCKTYKNVGSGQSGSSGAEGWAGEANLDIEWAYAMAPRAHIILVGVPPAETEGVQGFPNLFKTISSTIDSTPAGTVFSMSFGITEETFTGSSAKSQLAKFDAVFKKGVQKGDTFLASSGDDGSSGVGKQHRDSVYYDHPVGGWPASSPWVTAVGGTQLMKDWRWNPTSDMPFTSAGDFNADYFAWDTASGVTEPAWNESWLPAATGGGESILYGRPSWQSGYGSGKGRAFPDVAWNAAVNGGVLVYTSFFPETDRVGWHVYGGTSAASPQFAGLVALVNQTRGSAGPIGWLSPVLYDAGKVDPSTAFRDVVPDTFGTTPSGHIVDNGLWSETDGQDVSPPTVPGPPVTTGWDETTGFGVPRAGALVAPLAAATPVTP
jgi:subtilase family serine protease